MTGIGSSSSSSVERESSSPLDDLAILSRASQLGISTWRVGIALGIEPKELERIERDLRLAPRQWSNRIAGARAGASSGPEASGPAEFASGTAS
jgi:hypothetical protein